MSRSATQRRGTARVAALAVLLAAILPACGRRGLPRPPQWVLPAAPADLSVEQTSEGAMVRFRSPDSTVDGSAMHDLAWLEIWRTCPPETAPRRVARVPIFDAAGLRPRQDYAILDASAPDALSCAWQVVAISADGDQSAPAVFPTPLATPTTALTTGIEPFASPTPEATPVAGVQPAPELAPSVPGQIDTRPPAEPTI